MRLPTRRARTGAERAAAVSSARAAAEAEAQAAQEVMAQEHASRVASLEVSRAKTEGQRAAHELAAPLQADYLQAAKLQAELEAARVREEAAAAKHRSELARDASMHKASGLDATRPDDGGAHEAAFGRVRLAHEQALATERQRSVEAERKLEAVVAEQRAAYEATGSQLRWLSDHGKEEATRLWCVRSSHPGCGAAALAARASHERRQAELLGQLEAARAELRAAHLEAAVGR